MNKQAPASVQRGQPSVPEQKDLAPMEPKHRWHSMYLGAFAALGIANADVAHEMAEATRSDEEAIAAIHVLRRGKEGDRVWPALDWLRMKRK